MYFGMKSYLKSNHYHTPKHPRKKKKGYKTRTLWKVACNEQLSTSHLTTNDKPTNTKKHKHNNHSFKPACLPLSPPIRSITPSKQLQNGFSLKKNNPKSLTLAAMAMLSTSLSGPKSATSYCAPEFSGLRRLCPNSNNNNSNSHSQSFLRFCSPRKPLKSVVAMAGTGTVRF
jgi:hypothetical protein